MLRNNKFRETGATECTVDNDCGGDKLCKKVNVSLKLLPIQV